MTKRLIILFLVAIAAAACAKPESVSTLAPKTDYRDEIRAYEEELANQKPSASLWQNIGNRGTLFLDYKGRQEGDIIIVRITESSSASNSNSTNTSKTTGYDSGITSVLGLPTNFGVTNFMNSGNSFDPTVSADTSNSFSGQGSKSKADTVSATIAARIMEVLPSGNLVIEGNREIVVDQEKQVITVRGIVRQKDIDADNMVASTAIADAQINYSGKGIISDANKKGWLASAIDWVWPF